MAQDFIEKIFTEIEIQCLNTTNNVIIRLIYIIPDSDTIFFNQEKSDIKKKYQRKQIHKINDW